MLRIHLFGQLRVFLDQTPLKLSAPPRAIPLWAYLLLNREALVTRESLALLLWPDEPRAEARANVRRHLYHLQRALPPAPAGQPWILSDGDTVRWNPQADAWIDVVAFEQLGAREDGLQEAAALYAGDLLAQLYDEWLFYERERLRYVYHTFLERLSLRYQATRDYQQALLYVQRLLASDPLREDAMRQSIALHYKAGDRAGALQEYERCAALLQAELDVEPMPETEALYEAIVRNAPLADALEPGDAPLAPAPGPARPTLPFAGRQGELAQLRAWWSRAARGHGETVLLAGQAGIGKTRLTAELVLLVEAEGARVLRGRATLNEPLPYQALLDVLRAALPLLASAAVQPAWLAALAPLLPELRARQPELPALPRLDPAQDQQRLVESLARCLEALAQPRPLLIILEDLHWAGATTIALVEFLARRVHGHRIMLLLTHREEEMSPALREMTRRLRREQATHHVALSRLDELAVSQLVAQLPTLDEPPEELARYLYAESEGNPLFIAQLLSDRREARRQPAGPPAPGAPAALDGLQATITARLGRLSPEAQVLARMASTLGSAFSVELVRELAGWSEGETLDYLDELLDRQLIREAADQGRYDYAFAHHLIQQTIYAAIPGETLTRYHRRACRVLERLYPDQLAQLAATLALHADRGGDAERAAEYYLAAAAAALAVYAYEEVRERVARALELGRDPYTRFQLLALREQSHDRLGQREPQRTDLEEMATLAARLKSADLACEVLSRQIRLHNHLGERDAAAGMIEELKRQSLASGHERWQAEALQAEAVQGMLLSQYDAARGPLERALELRRALGDLAGAAECCCLLAELTIHQGQSQEGRQWLERAETLAGAEVNQSLLSKTLRAAFAAAYTTQDFTAGRSVAARRLAISRDIGDSAGEADACKHLAMAAAQLFLIDEARQHFSEAAALYGRQGDMVGQAAVLINAGVMETRLGRYEEQLPAFVAAEEIFRGLDDLRGQAICAINIADTARLLGDQPTAQAAALRALDLARAMNSQTYEANALASLGASQREAGLLDQAIAHMEQGLALRRDLGQPANQGADLCDLTLAYLQTGRLDQARQAAEEMLAIYATEAEHMLDPQYQLWVAAQTFHTLGEPERAEELMRQAYAVLLAKAQAIPDLDSRIGFLRHPFNDQLLAAHDRLVWPMLGARGEGRGARS
jgi:predicted ATPase/DNA-binding SARP family transcriptional activator